MKNTKKTTGIPAAAWFYGEPGFHTTTRDDTPPRIMVDLCLCGHGRSTHVSTYQGCVICTKKGPAGVFTCRPGTCDRFTWNPDAEPK